MSAMCVLLADDAVAAAVRQFCLGEWVELAKGYRLPDSKTGSRVTGKTIDRKDNLPL